MFERSGAQNTDKAIEMAVKAAKEHGISHLVVASTKGDTARKALEAVKGTGLKLVVVTHSTGFGNPGVQEFDPELRKEIETAGHHVLTGVHMLRGLGKAIKNRIGWSEEELVAHVLRIFGQGMKVCVEIVAMATDAGLAPCPGNVVAVAGTGRGADTVVIIGSAPTHNFFDIKVRKIVAKPFEF